MVAAGKISADEAARLLAALDADEGDRPDPTMSEGSAGPLPADTRISRFGNPWLIPMYVGLALFVCGALAVFPLYSESGSWLLAVCGWPLFVIGFLTLLAAWLARKARWIHVRVTNVDGSKRNIRFSLPLPLRLSAWALKIAARWAPQLKGTSIDELFDALNEGLKGDQPLTIDVQEGDGGERVQVYIG